MPLCIKKKNVLCLYDKIDIRVCKYCCIDKGYPKFICKILNHLKRNNRK